MRKEPDTESSLEVIRLREIVIEWLEKFCDHETLVKIPEHRDFALLAFKAPLRDKFKKLHSSGTWLVYWCIHTLAILQELIPNAASVKAIEWLESVESAAGGFGGSPGQIATAGLTYAGIIASIYCGFNYNRARCELFFHNVALPYGGFEMHEDGECDCRSVYCVVASAHCSGLLTKGIMSNATAYLATCQNLDGGFGGEPGAESHAGYTWCALAALALIGTLDAVDAVNALQWLLQRQSMVEGGCTGRPNKLVDTCYSFYVVASTIIAKYALRSELTHLPSLDEDSLARYVLKCCQPCIESGRGGLCDKPGLTPDWYHTAYGLAGVAMLSKDYGLACISPILNLELKRWHIWRDALEVQGLCHFGPGELDFHKWYVEEYRLRKEDSAL